MSETVAEQPKLFDKEWLNLTPEEFKQKLVDGAVERVQALPDKSRFELMQGENVPFPSKEEERLIGLAIDRISLPRSGGSTLWERFQSMERSNEGAIKSVAESLSNPSAINYVFDKAISDLSGGLNLDHRDAMRAQVTTEGRLEIIKNVLVAQSNEFADALAIPKQVANEPIEVAKKELIAAISALKGLGVANEKIMEIVAAAGVKPPEVVEEIKTTNDKSPYKPERTTQMG